MLKQKCRISPAAMAEVETAFKGYVDALLSSEHTETTQGIYENGASQFVRWLTYDYDPGKWVARYPIKRPKKRPVANVG